MRERKKKKEGESEECGGCCCASFQVSNATSGDGFKPNSLPPINIQAKREYINCLTITHFGEKEKNRGGGGRRYPSSIAFL